MGTLGRRCSNENHRRHKPYTLGKYSSGRHVKKAVDENASNKETLMVVIKGRTWSSQDHNDWEAEYFTRLALRKTRQELQLGKDGLLRIFQHDIKAETLMSDQGLERQDFPLLG